MAENLPEVMIEVEYAVPHRDVDQLFRRDASNSMRQVIDMPNKDSIEGQDFVNVDRLSAKPGFIPKQLRRLVPLQNVREPLRRPRGLMIAMANKRIFHGISPDGSLLRSGVH
jgi:hypothetical protein